MSNRDLPFNRIAKLVCSCKDIKKEDNEKITPDPRLVNWEKWITKRKRIDENIGKAIRRQPQELLTNCSDNVHAINVEKTVLENTKIIYPHDPYRGNPAFWRMPRSLQKKPCQPDYFAVMTKAEKCEIPQMSYMNVPDIIKEEKGYFTSASRNPKVIWDQSEYRKKRTKELSLEIKTVEPYKPDLSQLFIKGVRILPSPQALEKTVLKPDILDDDQSTSDAKSVHDKELYLLVDDRKLCSHSTGDVNVHLFFEYDINSRQLLTKSLKILNGTPYALRYYLTRRKKFFLFRDIVEEIEDQVFYYDKRELIMSPNKEMELPISFKSGFPSTYKLQLELHTRPQLWDSAVVINLLAVSIYADFEGKCGEIRKRVESKICETIVKDTLFDILKNIPTSHLDYFPIFYTYDKAAIFEAVNQDFSPVNKRPKYIYNKEVVEKLEDFYTEIRLPDSPPAWNFNIEDLREMTKKRQELNYQNLLVDQLLIIKTAAEEKKAAPLPEPVERELSRGKIKKGSKVSQNMSLSSLKKSRDMRSKSQIGHKMPFGENLLEKLENLILELQQPSVWVNENENLHEACYTLLCTTVDVILAEVRKVEIDLNIFRKDKYPAHYTYDANTFEGRVLEVHDDLSAQSPRIKEEFIGDALPVADCLKGIPFNETDKRHKTYYGIVDEPVQQVKGKQKDKKGKEPKKAADKKGKGKNEKVPESKGKKSSAVEPAQQYHIDLKENRSFNILEEISTEIYGSSKKSTSSDEEISDLTPNVLLNEYKRCLHDIFYRNLSDAIARLVDVVELHKNKKGRLENMKVLIEEASLKTPPVQLKLIDLKKAIRLAMELPDTYQSKYSEVKAKPLAKPANLEDLIQPKEEGSEWSILKPPKRPEVTQRPISYPELSVYLKRKTTKSLLQDVGTVMSNAGIDPYWADFKDVGVQIITKQETRAQKEYFIGGILGQVVSDICLEETGGGERGEGERETRSSDDLFYDEELPEIPSDIYLS